MSSNIIQKVLSSMSFLIFILLCHHHHRSISMASPILIDAPEVPANSIETTSPIAQNPSTTRPVSEPTSQSISEDQPASGSTVEMNDSPISSDLPDVTSFKNTSTFTCYGRPTGYYADIKLGCQVYHFCTQMDGIGEMQYQRMSYICLEGSIFDQSSLNCVADADLKVPCNEAESHYENSNKQFDEQEDSQPSYSDSLAANIMMNPLTRYLAGR